MQHVKLKEDEIVKHEIRQHPAVLILPLFFAAVFFMLPFFILVPLMSIGFWGFLVGFFFLALGATIGLRSYLLWRSNVFLVTTRRIIDVERRGFFDWVVSEASYPNIEDISYRTVGVMQNLMGTGNVVIQTASGFVNLILEFVRDPAGVRDAINEVRETYERPAR